MLPVSIVYVTFVVLIIWQISSSMESMDKYLPFAVAVCSIKCTVFMTGLFGELGHRETSMGSPFWKRTTFRKLCVFLLC